MGNQREDRSQSNEQRQADQANDSKTPLFEWIVAAMGFILMAGSLGYLAYAATAKSPSPPDIIIQSQQVVPMTNGYLLKIHVLNKGGATVANLRVKGRLRSDSGIEEESETTFDYVPSNSRRKGGLLFRRDPRASRVELRAGGYQEP